MGIYADAAGPVGHGPRHPCSARSWVGAGCSRRRSSSSSACSSCEGGAPRGPMADGVIIEPEPLATAHLWVGGLLLGLAGVGLLHLAGGRPGLDASTHDLSHAGGSSAWPSPDRSPRASSRGEPRSSSWPSWSPGSSSSPSDPHAGGGREHGQRRPAPRAPPSAARSCAASFRSHLFSLGGDVHRSTSSTTTSSTRGSTSPSTTTRARSCPRVRPGRRRGALPSRRLAAPRAPKLADAEAGARHAARPRARTGGGEGDVRLEAPRR